MAATFCHSILYALTPLFGVDFPSLCIKPEDPSFAHMVIDGKIVRDCTATALTFSALFKDASHAGTPSIKRASSLKTWSTRSARANPNNPADSESGYGTDTDRSDRYFSSPQTPLTAGWTALNTPVSSTQTTCGTPSSQKECTGISHVKHEEPLKCLNCDEARDGKRHSKGNYDDSGQESCSSQSSGGVRNSPKRRRMSRTKTKESQAAYSLMQLRLGDASQGDSPNGEMHVSP